MSLHSPPLFKVEMCRYRNLSNFSTESLEVISRHVASKFSAVFKTKILGLSVSSRDSTVFDVVKTVIAFV